MCGIIGYVGNEEAWPIILEGLQRLEYRGYDSAGIAVIDPDGKLEFRKTVGKVKGLLDNPQLGVPRGSVGLGHTRWATHGAPSHANAHPHTECNHRVAVVHNGIVENFLELKRDLQARGHAFTSETDSEVIAHLIEEGLSQGYSLERACREMAGLLRGSQAIAAMLSGDEPVLCALRLGHAGGLVVAHHKGQGIVGSDLAAALPLLGRNSSSQRVVYLESGEMALITRETVKYQDLDGNSLVKQSARVSPEDLFIDKGGHRHFMLKEIMEQPQAVSGALRERVDFTKGRVVLPEFPISDPDICSLDKVVLIGCGTSLHAAQVGRHLVERLAGLPAEADSASEFRYRSPLINSQTLVVSIGQSGETADTIAAMQEAQERGARLI
ncbi:MAG: isomerizing glutamine--fructose-6-phosphate transaminase, partial [Dehalococcoidia bacterium]